MRGEEEEKEGEKGQTDRHSSDFDSDLSLLSFLSLFRSSFSSSFSAVDRLWKILRRLHLPSSPMT